MSRHTPIYEGKAKILYEGPEPGTLIQHFKDDATEFNGEKHAVIPGKGVLNCRISEYIMTCLDEIGIPTHFIKSLNMREQLVRAVEVVPIEVIIRNVTAGSLAKRFGVEEGMILPRPIVEFCLKSDKLGDPLVTQDQIVAFEWAMQEELDEMRKLALRINDFLTGLFQGVGIKLVDLKLEFGRIYDEDGALYLLLADEISPDSCRLWDTQTGDKMDKDRFRQDLGGLEKAYQEVARRLGVLTSDHNDESILSFSLEDEEKPKKPSRKKKTVKKPTKKK